MMDEDNLIRLFEMALELPLDEREEFVSRACGDDVDSAAKLLAMLTADSIERGLLDLPFEQVAVRTGLYAETAQDTDETGRRIGNYRLVECLGRGGMGVVYRAERADGAFSQEVALKLIRSGKLRASARARFLRERAILAQMKHPHIAQLMDGGLTEDDEPWFAMEYVDGEPLLRWCDSKQFDIATRIRLFLSICDAVSFAHSRLVVHRDIKPSNVLIDSNGVPKLLDFGIAKLLTADETDDESIPREQTFTPRYASPEQIRGAPVTVATDVHALGLLLYELLCGRQAFGIHTQTEIDARQEVLDHDALPMVSALSESNATETATLRRMTLPALRQALAGDLQWIIGKALNKEPEDRYRSAADFADDLRRYLADKPIAARSSTSGYRLRKFLRRNRVAAILVGIITLTIVAGLSATAWQHHRTLDAVRATAAVDRLFTSTLGNAVVSGLGSTPFSSASLLNRTEQELRGLSLADQPAIYAHGLASLARSYAVIGDYAHAESLAEEAQNIAENEYDDDGFIAATQLSMLNIRARYAAAEQLATKLIAELDGRDDIRTLVSRITFQSELAQAQWGLRDPATALQTLDQVLTQTEALGKGHDELVAQILILRSRLRFKLLRLADAQADAQRATALVEHINPVLADDARERLVEARSWKVAKDSTEIAKQLLESRQKTLGQDHPKTGKALLLLSYAQGRTAAGEENYFKGRAIIEAAYGKNHPEYAYALSASPWAHARNVREVIAAMREAVRIDEQTLGPTHEVSVNARRRLGVTLLLERSTAAQHSEEIRESLALLQGALNDKRTANIPAPFETLYLGYGLLLFGQDEDLPRVEKLFREAQDDAAAYFTDSDTYSIQAKWWYWNKLRYRQGFREEADRGFADWLDANRDYMQAVIDYPNLNQGVRNSSLYDALIYRALYAFETCRKNDAERFLAQVIEFNKRVSDRDEDRTRGYLENLRKKNTLFIKDLTVPPSENITINARAQKCPR